MNFSTSVIWEKGQDLGNYVSRAGGRADNADKWKTHVVYANGESRRIKRFWPDPEVRPGSTIVVPYKPPPVGDSKLSTFKEIASIIASVAMVWLVVDSTK